MCSSDLGYSKLKTGQVLIVQPQSKFGIARKSILSRGMAIISEKLAFEKDNITPVVLAFLDRNGSYSRVASLQKEACARILPVDFGFELPPWYFEDESFLPAIELERKKNLAIMANIKAAKQRSSDKMKEAYDVATEKINYINQHLK